MACRNVACATALLLARGARGLAGPVRDRFRERLDDVVRRRRGDLVVVVEDCKGRAVAKRGRVAATTWTVRGEAAIVCSTIHVIVCSTIHVTAAASTRPSQPDCGLVAYRAGTDPANAASVARICDAFAVPDLYFVRNRAPPRFDPNGEGLRRLSASATQWVRTTALESPADAHETLRAAGFSSVASRAVPKLRGALKVEPGAGMFLNRNPA